MKIAHFLMVHKNPEQTLRLVNKLLVMGDDVYIHIDAKCDKSIFFSLTKLSHVYVIDKSIDVKWGGYSQVKATVVGMKAILDSEIQYDYINFLSGQDYPIRPIKEFHQFLSHHSGSEFIEYIFEHERPEVTRKRIYKYNLTEYTFKGKYFIQKILNLLTSDRKFPIPNFTIVWKANWFILTPTCVKFVVDFLEENPKVVRFFKFGWGVDEFVFQSIIYNSPFKDNMVNKNYRYVDWTKGQASPKTLDLTDFDKFTNSDNFFARKFDADHDKMVLDRIDQNLLDH